jgi:short-subunit dehydrogenase
MDLAHAAVIVTGAGHGIGRATATALAARGALVTVVDRDSSAGCEIAAQIGGTSLTVDVADPGHAEQVVAQTLATFGRIDAVVANAGIGYVGPFAAMPVETIESMLAINLRAPMLLARAALPIMFGQGSGALVFTTSIAGTLPVPTEAAYTLSKTALEAFADAIREEVRPAGIMVSTVRPGVVRTRFHDNRNVPYERRWPRPIRPERIAQAIVDVLETGAERRTVPSWLDLATRTRRRLPWAYRALSRRLG